MRPLIQAVAQAAMADLGIGVIELQQGSDGWRRTSGSPYERRIDGLSGLSQPEQALRCSGPAAAVFRHSESLGYRDGLGERIIGTFANCAGGHTPGARCSALKKTFSPR